MISMYTGSVGSGKSYHALEIGLKVMKEKKNGVYRHVIANFPLVPSKKINFGTWRFREKINTRREEFDNRWTFNPEISIEFLIAESLKNGWYGHESMCMVIIDEAGIIFNSRDWQTMAASRNKWIKFLALSRKFGYDFVFVCQSDRMIDKQIRGLCEYEVRHLKANNSFLFSFLSLFKITMFMYIYQWYQTKIRGNLRFSMYKSSIGSRYDTMRVFDFDELIMSVKALYEGKIIPAPVAAQLDIWESEKIQRALEMAELDRKEREAYEAQLKREQDRVDKVLDEGDISDITEWEDEKDVV